MSYRLNAWLDEGRPRLQVIDATSGAVRLAWRYQEPNSDGQGKDASQRELKRLFRELMLLTVLQNLGEPSR